MGFENYRSMDPHLLVGLVNTAIRNEYKSFQELCIALELESEILAEKLTRAGYRFMPEQQQFR